MKISDLLIIYLASGAPFAVYYFLQNRKILSSVNLGLRTFFVFSFWLPFAFKFVKINRILPKKPDKNYFERLNFERKLFGVQKQIEEVLLSKNYKISIYELREVFERYVGLTIALQNFNEKATDATKEIFLASGNKKSEISAVCLQRRNRERLLFHHTQARRDFLKTVNLLSEFDSYRKKLNALTVKFVTILNDREARAELEAVFNSHSQTVDKNTVNHSEQDLWKTGKQKPSPMNSMPTHLQALAAATKLQSKD